MKENYKTIHDAVNHGSSRIIRRTRSDKCDIIPLSPLFKEILSSSFPLSLVVTERNDYFLDSECSIGVSAAAASSSPSPCI